MSTATRRSDDWIRAGASAAVLALVETSDRRRCAKAARLPAERGYKRLSCSTRVHRGQYLLALGSCTPCKCCTGAAGSRAARTINTASFASGALVFVLFFFFILLCFCFPLGAQSGAFSWDCCNCSPRGRSAVSTFSVVILQEKTRRKNQNCKVPRETNHLKIRATTAAFTQSRTF